MNKTISISIPHRLTQEEARRRLASGITDLKGKYAGNVADVSETWTGNQLTFRLAVMGQAITGRADVLAETVKLDVDLPWLLATLAEKFRPRVEQEARRMLERKPGPGA